MGQGERVLIAGGGIGGLSLALTLHQIGVPCLVLETAAEMKPLGVGINLQPNAVRELFDLGIAEGALATVGLPIREWALVGLNGKEIFAEPRGRDAGYHWPQYAVHRGEFHMLLYRTVVDRLGPDAVRLDRRVEGYSQTDCGSLFVTCRNRAGEEEVIEGRLLIGADGIHSTVRQQMHPLQPPIHWGGALMWRGTVRAPALRTGASFVGLGAHHHRMVIYPISEPDSEGLSLINWIAELVVDSDGGWKDDRWFRPVEVDDFVHHFGDFTYDWLNVPEMLRAADCSYENPMIDRDPIPTWVDGRVALLGDAAHAMYPTGSNGAGQAIIDGRILAAKVLQHGLSAEALAAYDEQLCGPVSDLVLRNRGAGPFGLLDLLNERSGGAPVDDIDAVLPEEERRAYMRTYKRAAGFDIERLNSAPPTIAEIVRG